MWRRGNDFEVIPRLFEGENELILPYCGREN